MARVRFIESILTRVGHRVDYAETSVLVNTRGGSDGDAIVYAEATGTAEAPNPVTVEDGEFSAWLEPGRYDLIVDGETRPVEVVDAGAVAVTNEAPLNVQWPEYGAVGDGLTTTDGDAVQSAVTTACAATNGGEVYIPPGLYITNSGVAIPATGKIYLHSGGWRNSTLKRTSGTTTVLSVTGDNNLARVKISGLALDGGGTTSGYVFDALRCNDMILEDLEFRSSLGTGVRFRKVFNSHFRGLSTHACGNGTASPAMLMDAVDEAQGGCDTVFFIGCQWEGNSGTDLKLTGAQTVNGQANNAPQSGIHFVGGKMEGGTGAIPYLDIDYGQGLQFAGGFRVVRGASRTGVMIQQAGDTSMGTVANMFTGCLVDATQGVAQAHYVYMNRGSMVWAGGTILGSPSTAFFHVGSGPAAGRFKFDPDSGLVTNVGRDKLLLDDRPVPSVVSAATVTLPAHDGTVSVTGTADVTSITATFPNDRVILIFPGTAATNGIVNGSNLKIGSNFAYTPNDILELVCDGTNWYQRNRSAN